MNLRTEATRRKKRSFVEKSARPRGSEMALAFDEFGRPFIIRKEQEKKAPAAGIGGSEGQHRGGQGSVADSPDIARPQGHGQDASEPRR
ncbi:hypothetical protein Cni_G12883 [Canna indica]|uniref:Uncharacterized protein n=1 Tax=Canna indica TaxID=4628 RepID=A0AAQ3K8L7_9LILI|nr:hypothetical protein Cni_G12883 [Canna indica]